MKRNISLLLGYCLTIFTAVAQPAKSATDLYNDGMKLVESKSYQEALDAFKKAIAKDPANGDALYEAGWVCNELAQYSEAVTYLEKAKKIKPGVAKIYFELGYADENTKNEAGAISSYKKALELYPEYYSAAQSLGDLYYNKEDYENALNYYRQYLYDADADNYYNYKAGWCCNDLEKYSEAISYLEKYEPTENEDIAKKFAEIGYANYKLENEDEAVDAYEKAIDAKPGYGAAYRGLGNVYYDNSDKYDDAITNYELAIQYDEENSKADYYKLGWLYNDAEKYDDAVAILLKAVGYDPKDAGTREELGYAYYMTDNNIEALNQLDMAIELDPKSKLGYYYKGLCYIDKGEKDMAMEMYNKLKEISPDQAEKLLAKINGN